MASPQGQARSPSYQESKTIEYTSRLPLVGTKFPISLRNGYIGSVKQPVWLHAYRVVRVCALSPRRSVGVRRRKEAGERAGDSEASRPAASHSNSGSMRAAAGWRTPGSAPGRADWVKVCREERGRERMATVRFPFHPVSRSLSTMMM